MSESEGLHTLRTLAREARCEIPKIKGSRFLASAARVASVEEAEAFLDARRRELRDATHHCWAWRLGPDRFRYGDDGEPSGSAGRPILREIDGRGLVEVAVVVTRYYGGTKLGTGGLARAYGAAARAVLEEAGVLETPRFETLRLRHAYADTAAVAEVLHAFEIEPRDARYGDAVDLALEVPVDRAEPLCQALRDATGGRVEIESRRRTE